MNPNLNLDPDALVQNFSPRAQRVLALGRQEAERLNHNYIGTEHLLLGLIKLGQGGAFNVLQKFGIDLETVHMEVEKQAGIGPDYGTVFGNISYTPFWQATRHVKRCLAFAVEEAKSLNDSHVGTEHILLGVLREGGGVAARALRDVGVDAERIRRELAQDPDRR